MKIFTQLYYALEMQIMKMIKLIILYIVKYNLIQLSSLINVFNIMILLQKIIVKD